MLLLSLALITLGQNPGSARTVEEDLQRFKRGARISTFIDYPNGAAIACPSISAYEVFLAACKAKSLKGLQKATSGAAAVRSGHALEVVAYHVLASFPVKAPAVEATFLDAALKGKTYLFPAQYLRGDGAKLLPGEFSLPLFALVRDEDYKASPGDELELYSKDGAGIYVTKDLFAYEEFIKSARARDQAGIDKQLESRRVTLAEGGTKVLVLKRHDNRFIGEGVAAVECRILGGPLKDESVWVPEFSTASYTTKLVRDRFADPVPSVAKPKESRAAAVLKMGQGLERSKKLAAALGYYKQVVTEFPDSPEAKSAAERIRAIGK